jgi:GNAT superfamily N-acetyltransferase
MPLSNASHLSRDLPGIPLDESLLTALHTAADLAGANRQQYAGAEHLLLAILDQEGGAGPGHAILQTLKTNISSLRRSLAAHLNEAGADVSTGAAAFRSDCHRIIKLANQLRRDRAEPLLHAGHVIEGLICDGTGKTAKWISLCLGIDRHHLAQLPLRLRRGLHRTGVALGLAWELPETAEDMLGRILFLNTWTARSGPYACLQPGVWDQMECYLYLRRNKLRVLLCPSELTTRIGRWLCGRSVISKSASLAALTGARQLSLPQFFDEWPTTLTDFAGRLNPAFFTSRNAAGQLRLMTEADIPFCRDLYAHLEQRHQVPAGFSGSMEQWLHEPDSLRFAIELDGSLAGCGGFSLQEVSVTAEDTDPKLKIACLSFGLVHPRFQRYGLGSTLLAFRLAAAHHMGHFSFTAEATSCSVDYLERAGFRFWRTWRSPSRENLFSGVMQLTDEDAGLLQEWLGPERAACLGALPAPSLKSS